MNPWFRVSKGDRIARQMADKHYTRKRIGHPQWTRPGYNYVLRAEFDEGRAVFVWWRPKWEAGVERMDKLRVIECTMFRLEGRGPQASSLIEWAVDALSWSEARRDLHLDALLEVPTLLLTGVNSKATAGRRSCRSPAGNCFRAAGWYQVRKVTGRADVWLAYNNNMGQQ